MDYCGGGGGGRFFVVEKNQINKKFLLFIFLSWIKIGWGRVEFVMKSYSFTCTSFLFCQVGSKAHGAGTNFC